MKISIFQLDTVWLDKEANLKKIREAFNQCENPDLFLLPEMFNTGYIMQPEQGAEELGSITTSTLADIVKDTKTIIAGSIPTSINGTYQNSFVFVDNNGLVDYYSKQHLFKPAGEGENYAAGDKTITVDINNVKVKPLICYDLRFPYISYNRSPYYDLLVYSANWPKARIAQWRSLLIARAIENQSYVIGVNRVGSDVNGYEYTGHSIVVDYKGDVVLEFGENESVNSITLDFSELYEYRRKLPFLEDQI